MITIVDYGLGNLGSVANMLRRLGVLSKVTSSVSDLSTATALILPGVGHFDRGMRSIVERGFKDVLSQRVLEAKVPVLGICLGMQLLGKGSEEGTEAGLGWVNARAHKFVFSPALRLPVPHMGWNSIEPKDSQMFAGHEPERTRFYFVHSFHVVCESEADVAATSVYGTHFTSALRHDNIWGVQFHPEKSHSFGMRLLKNFVDWSGSARVP
jgi:glutamine amidotransferase